MFPNVNSADAPMAPPSPIPKCLCNHVAHVKQSRHPKCIFSVFLENELCSFIDKKFQDVYRSDNVVFFSGSGA